MGRKTTSGAADGRARGPGHPARHPGVAAADYPNPGTVTGSANVHDPAMVRAAKGTYILAATGTNLPLRTLTDRIAFSRAGVVWPNGAPWAHPFTHGSNM